MAQASRSLLMVDFDGTLAPFRKDRKNALPYPGVAAALQNILGTGKTRVVIISGRDVTETVPLLSIKPHPEVWGLHGLQRLKADGTVELGELDEPTTEALAAAENWVRSQNLVHAAEIKIGSIAMHWRGLPEGEAQAIRDRVSSGWREIAQRCGLDLMDFDGGIEIRSRKVNKGTAVRTILSEMDADVPAAYLGDDNTDEDAFHAIGGRGLSILVRPEWKPTAAHIWIKPPDELLGLLEGWIRADRGRDEMSAEMNLSQR
ncbi:MAG: trehalose-phosphatase [Candidatus Sulfotelmatobacter sp.]